MRPLVAEATPFGLTITRTIGIVSPSVELSLHHREQGDEILASRAFERVRKLARDLANVEEGTTYAAPALKVRGKMFACIASHRSAEPNTLAVRMSFLERDLRLSAEPTVYYLKPHYENYPVVLCRLAKIGDEDLRDLLEVGWQFVQPHRQKKRH